MAGHGMSQEALDEWTADVDEVSDQIKGIINGTLTDFDELDRKVDLKKRVKQIREEDQKLKKERFFANGLEGKGEGTRYKWWCKRCFVEYLIDLPENKCTRCKQDDMMMTQTQRREELMGKLDNFKETRAKHQFRKDKWIRWKKSQALLKKSKYINYKAWEYWEPDTETEEEGDPIVPRNNPEFLALEADMKQKNKKRDEKNKTARKCKERGNDFFKAGDFLGAIENYEEALEYRRDDKAIWTNKALAEIKIFRWHDAIASCNKVIEYSEIFEDGFTKSADACFKAFTRRAMALRALHRWGDAIEDLKDAVKLFPKDREARDLLEKTKQANEEAKRVRALEGGSPDAEENSASKEVPSSDEGDASGIEANKENKGSNGTTAQQKGDTVKPAPAGPVRVAIEESESEEEDDAVEIGPAASPLVGMSAKEFATFFGRLGKNSQERARFCLRGAATGLEPAPAKKGDWISKKLEIKVEEVVDPSGLDLILKDIERCSVLFKKQQGKVVPLRTDVHRVEEDEEPGEREAIAFVEKATPRLLQVLHLLASHSDNHCELTSHAVRHVWPLIVCPTWRYTVLQLLMEWSQRSVSQKTVAEFASRYPEPHFNLLIDAVTSETKDNILPPNFEEGIKKASAHMESGQLGMDAALEKVMQGLSAPSVAELAISSLGNMSVAGQLLPAFKNELAAHAGAIVSALKSRLKAFDWRLCGRAAGALTNMLRLGDSFAVAIEEQCVEALVTALREECSDAGSLKNLQQLLEAGESSGYDMPFSRSRGRLLSVFVNLLAIRPSAAQTLLQHGVLEIAIPLIDPEAASKKGSTSDDATPTEVSNRATLIVSRLLMQSPTGLKQPFEGELLGRLFGILERAGDFKPVVTAVKEGSEGDAGDHMFGKPAAPWLDQLELAVRLLTLVVQKVPGALARLSAGSARVSIEELPDDYDETQDKASRKSTHPSWTVKELLSRCVKLVKALQPPVYLSPNEEGGILSRLRGNVALLLSCFAEVQAPNGADLREIKELDLSPLVGLLVDILRKERGKAQNNVGVCVTRLAQCERYLPLVRDLKGIETLHHIQKPRVEAEKEKASRLHRLRSVRGMD